jgi:nucleotide-binding universal stress UspA family protein
MYQRILVPFDGSATSSRGLTEAIQLARLSGARLRLVHMVDDLLYASGFESSAIYMTDVVPLMRAAGETILQQGKARAERAGVPVETVLLEGVATRLADAVDDQVGAWGADLIVIGTHGRRGLGRLLMGSDAEQIARTARVPVLLVRAPEIAALEDALAGKAAAPLEAPVAA